ncbi:MAG: hypothetical protein LC107_14070 [Chitinophagales bacterium]|nr:hypothetical protein [Chitinophagales bacterium]
MGLVALFEERQRFTQWWLWVLLTAVNLPFLYGIFQQIIMGVPFGDKPMSDKGLLLTGGLLWLVVILFFSLKLETRIYEDRIEVRFFPLQLKTNVYYWDDIASAELRTYAPLKEYGGWGLRCSFCGYGKALNVSGNQGLQLVFKDGKKLLIGTGKQEVLAYVLEQIKKG